MLWGPRGLATVGVPLSLPAGARVVYADLAVLLADGEGLAEAYQWKGASGIRACFNHKNCLMINSDLATRVAGYVEIDCASSADFIKTSPAELERDVKAICAARSMVAAKTIPKNALDDYEKAAGLSCTSDGLLADDALRTKVQRAFTYDWVHCCLSGGTLTTEISLLATSGVQQLSWKSLEACFRLDRKFPIARGTKGRALWKVFQYSGRGDADKVKASCSELLGVYAIMRHYVCNALGDALVTDRLRDQIASFTACCEVVDYLLAGKRAAGNAEALAQGLIRKLQAHMSAHKKAYSSDHLLPKHHWLFDVADQWRRDGVLVDMFVTERLHLACKSIAEKIKDTRTFESSVLRMRAFSQSSRLRGIARCSGVALHGRQASHEGLAHERFCVAAAVDVYGMMVHAGDIVANKNQRCVGAVMSCVQAGGSFFVVVQEYRYERHMSSHTVLFSKPEGDVLSTWSAAEVQLCSAWYEDGRRTVVVM